MIQTPRFTRRARWAAPSGAVAAVGVVVAGSVLTSAAAAPALPPRTPAQLIAAIAANKSAPSSLSGTITWTAALGLPDLPAIGGPASIPSLLAGTHTIQVWYGGPGRLRLALPVQLGETDLRVDGQQVWLWDSQTNTATHIKLPTGPPMVMPPLPVPLPRGKASQHATASQSAAVSQGAVGSQQTASTEFIQSAPTPQAVARALLRAVGPTTTVSVQNVTVAGRAAYQLVLAPKNHGSLIGRVTIAVDASRYLPLRVQVFARGSASPAYQVGFTSISFARPAASNFAFTPPPGAKVKTITAPPVPFGPFGPFGALAGVNGGSFCGVSRQMATFRAIAPKRDITMMPSRRKGEVRRIVTPMRGNCQATRILPPGIPKASFAIGTARGAATGRRVTMKALPRRLSKRARQHLLKMLRKDVARARLVHPGARWHGAGWYGYAPMAGGMFPSGAVSAPRVIGSGWTAIVVFPAAGLTAGSVGGPQGAVLRSATPVHGSWGSGRLLRTSLFSVLITSNGKALIGAVTPAVLYAAAAQVK
jgi:outer membrane lipoprotein-sorting protein